jgi:hypothetical protein
MAHKALLEIVTEAFSLLRGPRGFVREDEDVGIKTGHDPRRAVSTTRVEAQPLTIGAKAFQDDVRVMGWHGLLISLSLQINTSSVSGGNYESDFGGGHCLLVGGDIKQALLRSSPGW